MVAIVSHDAGGAEILSSWLRQNPQPFCLVVEGPAISIFKRKIGKFKIYHLSKAIELCDWVLCGTSWQSGLEKKAISESKNVGKKVIAFLDHWVEFEGRFQINGKNVLPDEIWVGDIYADSIAKKTFPDVTILLQKNPYFEDLQIELKSLIKPVSSLNVCSILYICEPFSEQALLQYDDPRYFGYTEDDALNFFLNNLEVLGTSVNEIKIRLHPSEKKNKYDWVKKKNSLVTDISTNKLLIEQIVEADIIVGCESMAMVVGLLAQKRVISCVPFGGNKCGLPQLEIEHLQSLINKYQGILDDS